MNYAILRVAKLKTNSQISGSLKHAFREQDTPNADSSLATENTHIGADSVQQAMSKFKNLLPEKVRKNGVRCIEYLMAASPDKMNEMSREEQDNYFSDSLNWLKEKHGEENVVYSGIHRDESTPHMYAYVVPIDEKGNLNCRSFLGGSKHVLSELQDDFAEKVGKEHGMERGVKGSKAKHQTVKEYYTKLNKTEQNEEQMKMPRLLEKGVFINKIEKNPDIINRLAKHVSSLEIKNSSQQKQLESASRTIQSAGARLRELQPVSELALEDRKKLLDLARAQKIKADKERLQRVEARRQRKGKNQGQSR